MRFAMKFMLGLAAATAISPAMAQVRPIPDAPITRPPGSVLQPAAPTGPTLPPRSGLPKGPIQMPVRPQIALISEPPITGKVGVMRFRISNLGPASAVHLFAFRPGCTWEQTPGVWGLPLRIDQLANRFSSQTGNYTTSFDPRATEIPRRMNDTRGPLGDGIAVTNGTAEFQIQGVAGIVGGSLKLSDEVSRPDQQALFERDALAGYQRSIGNGTNCQPTAMLMVRDADSVWRAVNPDGTRNETFRSDGSARAVTGLLYTPRNRRTVTFGSTSALRDKLGAFMVGALQSTCNGVSSALGSPSYPVGISVRDGDLVFKIRSGPNGTRCLVRMQLTDLPTGATAFARFSTTKDGSKCRIGEGILLNEYLAYLVPPIFYLGSFNLDRSSQMLMPIVRVDAGRFMISQNGWLNPYQMPSGADNFSWRTSLAPLAGMLFCEPTAVNDHGIELRLDSVDVELPEGVSYP
ncbi:hypothetical protein [Novosphingobium sp. Chol11]|uniref:hypothetical protein n=1 Tax=Novosphingobium sp. Chol11 TaxID=1385763 RepID=UPI0025D62A03|nr:hypothetical protein [Novosphingobium sp. Chol11]